ncbi:MAG TPA: hypothetical protein VGK74_18890 [Symbiobacteriaceae bacterium]
MPKLVWLIVGVVFGAPAVIVLGLVVATRMSKGNPDQTVNGLWLVLAVVLTLFLFFAIRSGMTG